MERTNPLFEGPCQFCLGAERRADFAVNAKNEGMFESVHLPNPAEIVLK
jgi:hypothetical protein